MKGTYERHFEAVDRWPLVLRCPIDASGARYTGAGASGVNYRCDACGCTFKVQAAQARKTRVAKVLAAFMKRYNVNPISSLRKES